MRRWVGAGAVAALVLSAACGGRAPAAAPRSPAASPAVTAAPPQSAPATASKELQFAALEPGGDIAQLRDNAVAIVRVDGTRLDGTARAKATFKSRQLPQVRGAAALPQPEARVSAGKVFFADGAGVVRSLSPDGTVSEVTSFPLSSPQQMLSFAVSPDGAHLMAAVFTFPALAAATQPASVGASPGPGEYALELLSAAPGQPAASVLKKTWPQGVVIPRDALSLVGWSTEAPLATVDTVLGTTLRTQGRQIFGHVAELDASGTPGLMVGGSDCQAWAVLRDETVLCDDGSYQKVSVRARGGGVLFQPAPPVNGQYVDLTLAPDGSRLSYRDGNAGRLFVTGKDGARVELPSSFQPQGWLNPTTLIGTFVTQQGPGNMAVVRLNAPSRAEDLGFKGFFAGVVRGG